MHDYDLLFIRFSRSRRVKFRITVPYGWAAAIIKGRRRVEDVEAAVHAAALDARAVIRHGEGAVVERRAGGAAVGSAHLGDDCLLTRCNFVARQELATLS